MHRPWSSLPCLLALLCLGLGGAARAQGYSAAAPAQFSPAQRAEIVAIVRQALTDDPTILRDALAALQNDEGARRDAAEARKIRELAPEIFHAPGDPVAGNPAGAVTLVEFYDVRCPYCRSMAPAMDQLIAQDHALRVVYKDLPILGPQSVLGARALLAAQRQGGYAKLQTQLLTTDQPIDEALLQRLAAADGLDWARLKADMDDPAIAKRLSDNLALAHALGVQGTPALVIGDRMIPGATDLAGLRQLVGEARAGK